MVNSIPVRYVVTVHEDGTLKSYVNFLGIPVASFDAVITSPALSDGEMTTFRYDGRPDMEGAVIKGVVKDEFGINKSYYTGIITDPKTGIQYKGKFELKAQGPRYSNPNGGDSPKVFDFQSDIPGKPRVKSCKIKNSPLVNLDINVPEGSAIVTPPSTGGTTPPTTGGNNSPNNGGNTPPTTGGTLRQQVATTSPSTGGSTPPSIGGTTPSTNLNPSSSPITSSPSSPLS